MQASQRGMQRPALRGRAASRAHGGSSMGTKNQLQVVGRAIGPEVNGVVTQPVHPQPGTLVFQAGRGHVIVPRTGVQFTRLLPFESWVTIGKQLSAVVTSSAWCLGDWLIYGQQVYESRYREAVKQTGLDYQTLRNYAWVARRFELSRRRNTLSFGHHAEVAALSEPEQDFWLRKAEEFGWSTGQIRREVRASLCERKEAPEDIQLPRSEGFEEASEAAQGDQSVESQEIRVLLSREQSQLCEQAANREGLPLPAWAAQSLDRAARADST
jgi:hypothetical protein